MSNKTNRRTFMGAVAGAVGCLLGTKATARDPESRPNQYVIDAMKAAADLCNRGYQVRVLAFVGANGGEWYTVNVIGGWATIYVTLPKDTKLSEFREVVYELEMAAVELPKRCCSQYPITDYIFDLEEGMKVEIRLGSRTSGAWGERD